MRFFDPRNLWSGWYRTVMSSGWKFLGQSSQWSDR